MELLKTVKRICLDEDVTLQEVLDRYNKANGTNVLYNSFYRKLKEETIKHSEYVKIMNALGYDVVVSKKK